MIYVGYKIDKGNPTFGEGLSSGNLQEVVRFILQSKPNTPLQFHNGIAASTENIRASLTQTLSSVLLFRGEGLDTDEWVITAI